MVATQPSTVLFLAANPMCTQSLQLGEECRTIENKIRAAKYRDQIRFRSRWAARPDDLLQALNEDSPSILHFSGHGAGDRGLCFQSDDGSMLSVSAEGLEQVMQAAGTSVAVVVLNACFSEVQARALVTHVPCVIGMPNAIEDEAAITYAGAFYSALAFGRSVANAHQQGLVALALHQRNGMTRDIEPAGTAPCSPIPKLLTRCDTDANCIRIVTKPATRRRCELHIKATLTEFDSDVLARVTELLREITGDLSLEITDIKEGSVRLTISLSPDAAAKLMQSRATGRLNEICGFEVFEILESAEADLRPHGAGVFQEELRRVNLDTDLDAQAQNERDRQVSHLHVAQQCGDEEYSEPRIALPREESSLSAREAQSMFAAVLPQSRRKIRCILAIDDDEHILDGYRRGFGRDRTVFTTADPVAARQIAKRERCDLAVVELRLKGESGISLTSDLRRDCPNMLIVLCSGHLSVEVAVAAVHAGADAILFKPITAQDLMRRVEEGPLIESDFDDAPTLARAEWELITRALADLQGNRRLAARCLGIYRSSLERRLRKFPGLPTNKRDGKPNP